MKKIINSKQGFTLFELLVVISIIGILVGFGTVAFSGAQKRARDARRKQDMDAIQAALEQYYGMENGSYPATCYNSGELTSGTTTIMEQFPTDPKNSAPYVYSSGTCNTEEYCYCAYMEIADGNSGADCGAGSDYFCVSQRQ